ncbi:Outer membrane protein beta-barrel domain-containing protein [Chitinophaga jiangningensis]|uniref:Outer membrane protein beta-barrel domain-containing protein n=2 Tax=Chitinophaga jiangningensis TaxID=1419482 RepID=A0A1M7I148_9BACT|nr:Outer membrane protein beta-barrel domain-containing protein [Chitinophaga jiangningensis]
MIRSAGNACCLYSKQKPKKMKKLLLSIVALLIASISFGQAKWGILAGPNFSSVTYENLGTFGFTSKETSKILTSFRGGITVDIPIAEDFSIGTGLLYAGKGGKFKNSDVKVSLSYLQLPVMFQFTPEVGNGNLVLGVGPYFAVGLGGNYKNTIAGDVGAFDDEAGLAKLKRFDCGGTLQIGYQMPMGFYFGLNGDLGFVNAADNTDNSRKFKNASFGVSLGYKFSGR